VIRVQTQVIQEVVRQGIAEISSVELQPEELIAISHNFST
jgi:hypothetical protein